MCCNISLAEIVKLRCEGLYTDSIIMNDAKETLIVNGQNTEILSWSKDSIKFNHKGRVELIDRITGTYKIMIGDSYCTKISSNAF